MAEAAEARSWRKPALRVLVTGVVLAVLVWFVPGREMLTAFERVSFVRWLAVLGGMLALHIVAAWKWRLFVMASGVHCAVGDAMRAHGAGLFSNLFLPGTLATDVVRVTMLGRSGVSAAPIVVGSLADRLVDTVSLAVLASLGAAFAARGSEYWGIPAAIIVAGAAGVLAAPWLLGRLEDDRLPERVRGIAGKLLEAYHALAARPGIAVSAALLSLVLQGGFVVLAMLLGAAVGIDVPAAAWFFAWPLAKLAILVPLTISGLGVREAAFAGLMLPFGVEAALAVVVGLVWQTVQAALALVAGAGAYGTHRLLVSAESGAGRNRVEKAMEVADATTGEGNHS